MAIPEFDENGNLPPGIHAATWDQVSSRFGGSPDRQRLFAGLGAALDLLRRCGCRRIWLDGSYTVDVEMTEGRSPRDIDVCWDLAGVDLDQLTEIAPELQPLHRTGSMTSERFGGDYFPVLEPLSPGLVADFQRDRQGRRKGIVQLSLSGEVGADR